MSSRSLLVNARLAGRARKPPVRQRNCMEFIILVVTDDDQDDDEHEQQRLSGRGPRSCVDRTRVLKAFDRLNQPVGLAVTITASTVTPAIETTAARDYKM